MNKLRNTAHGQASNLSLNEQATHKVDRLDTALNTNQQASNLSHCQQATNMVDDMEQGKISTLLPPTNTTSKQPFPLPARNQQGSRDGCQKVV